MATGQDGIDDIRAQQGQTKTLDPNKHADDLQLVYNETKADINYIEDDVTVTPAIHRLDVYPDGGTPANVTLTMEPLANYREGYKCLVNNETDTRYLVNIFAAAGDGGSQLKQIKLNNAFTIYKRSGQWAFTHDRGGVEADITGESLADWGLVRNLPTGHYVQEITFSTQQELDDAGLPTGLDLKLAVPYVMTEVITNETRGYRNDLYITSSFDAANDNMGVPNYRTGANEASAISIGWSTLARREDLPVLGDLINTVVTDGLISVNVPANADPAFTPPAPTSVGTGIAAGDWRKIVGWQSGFTVGTTFDAANGELVIDAEKGGIFEGDGWANFSHSTNNTSVAFILGVRKASDGLTYFSQRPTQNNLPNTNIPGIISGGGFSQLEENDRLSIWVSAENADASLEIHDGNFRLRRALAD